ncbi:MAG: hypothetical protein Q7K28_03730 [Candidatus Wildermuthbacteria bacterium]|nr:hypothetical protein [Candidatus Wildermuthbacteria bacterium]
MVTVTETGYKYQVSVEDLKSRALVKDYGEKKKELKAMEEYLNRIKVRFAVVDGKLFIEKCDLND